MRFLLIIMFIIPVACKKKDAASQLQADANTAEQSPNTSGYAVKYDYVANAIVVKDSQGKISKIDKVMSSSHRDSLLNFVLQTKNPSLNYAAEYGPSNRPYQQFVNIREQLERLEQIEQKRGSSELLTMKKEKLLSSLTAMPNASQFAAAYEAFKQARYEAGLWLDRVLSHKYLQLDKNFNIISTGSKGALPPKEFAAYLKRELSRR